MSGLRKRLIVALMFISCVVLAGSTGYMLIEGWGFLDSIYMTIITIASVGYKEIHDLSSNGRIFTIILIISGVGSVTYAALDKISKLRTLENMARTKG